MSLNRSSLRDYDISARRYRSQCGFHAKAQRENLSFCAFSGGTQLSTDFWSGLNGFQPSSFLKRDLDSSAKRVIFTAEAQSSQSY